MISKRKMPDDLSDILEIMVSSQYKQQVNQYIKAKDAHKPHLMSKVFARNATLQMKVNTDNISFPSEVRGVANITETLVRNFNKSYENVYTICLSDTVTESTNTLDCRWLVVMTDKASQQLRVGYGNYNWLFEDSDSKLVSQLTIVIDNMIMLPIENQEQLMTWMEGISYPWAASAEVFSLMPRLNLLKDMRESLLGPESLS